MADEQAAEQTQKDKGPSPHDLLTMIDTWTGDPVSLIVALRTELCRCVDEPPRALGRPHPPHRTEHTDRPGRPSSKPGHGAGAGAAPANEFQQTRPSRPPLAPRGGVEGGEAA